jgi:hypothetical protein
MSAIRDWRREEAEEIYCEQKCELDHLREWLDCIKYDYYLERKRRELRVLALEMGVRRQMAMLAALERAEFSPAQPRVPAGSPGRNNSCDRTPSAG